MRIIAQVLDGTYGKSAVGVRACLARVNGDDWTKVAEAETDRHGRIEDWDSWHLERGLYRIVFDSDSYFSRLGATTAYPEVAVIFRMQNESVTFQVQLTVAPYSYSTYFGTMEAQSGSLRSPWPSLGAPHRASASIHLRLHFRSKGSGHHPPQPDEQLRARLPFSRAFRGKSGRELASAPSSYGPDRRYYTAALWRIPGKAYDGRRLRWSAAQLGQGDVQDPGDHLWWPEFRLRAVRPEDDRGAARAGRLE